MRLAITSDLHVDHHLDAVPLLASAVARLEPDVLVVAGDLTADESLLERTLMMLRPFAREAVFVPGNHDLWCRPDAPSSRERYEEILPARARAAGFHALTTGETPVFFGHRFAGVTGWFDYSLRSTEHDGVVTPQHYAEGRYGMLQWSDKLRVRWPDDEGRLLDDPAICDLQVTALATQLLACGAEPTVVVTHHLAFKELTTSRGELPWDFLNGFMGSARLGELVRQTPDVRLAIAGHTHFRKDVRIPTGAGSLRALTSPLGYPREYRHNGGTLAERVVERVTLVEL